MENLSIKNVGGYDEIYYRGEYCGDLLLNGIFRYFPRTPKKVVNYMLNAGFIGKPMYFETT